MTKLKALLATLLCFAASPLLAAEYTLTVEPNYPPNQAQDVYKPLLDYLAKATGQKFRLKVGANYHVHWRDLREAAHTDFAFEEAHFTDYRADRHGFTPLVRVADGTRYALLADEAMSKDGALGLIGYRIVSMPAPSMGYLLLSEIYGNPLAQPEIQSVARNWRDGVEMVFAGETDAAMVPNYIAQLYPNLTPVFESREFPGRALSASGTVPNDVRAAVVEAMLKLHEDSSLYEVLVELGSSQFVPATRAEYAGNERMLRSVFGYKAKANAAPAAQPAVEDPATDTGVTVKAGRDGG